MMPFDVNLQRCNHSQPYLGQVIEDLSRQAPVGVQLQLMALAKATLERTAFRPDEGTCEAVKAAFDLLRHQMLDWSTFVRRHTGALEHFRVVE
jgi:hypothetical protein